MALPDFYSDMWTYDLLNEYFFDYYRTAFGQVKLEKVAEKVISSSKISTLISKARYSGKIPNHLDYIYSLNYIPYFAFASNETHLLGALFSLKRWVNEVNNSFYILTDHQLKQIAINIVNNHTSK